MNKKDDTRNFRMIPLRDRNWAMMILTFIGLIMLVLTVILLLPAVAGSTLEGQVWLWLTIGVTSFAGVLSLFALITGDPLWFLIGLLLARTR